MRKVTSSVKVRARAMYVMLAVLAVSAFILPTAAFATEGPGPAEPATTDAAAIAGEGAKSLIGFLWAVLPYLVGVAIVMFVARWLMKRFGFSRA
jgi:Ca2+/H+ antiporter